MTNHFTASRYLDLLERHFNVSFLDQIPDRFRSLTDKNAEINMIEEPDVNHYVFLKVQAYAYREERVEYLLLFTPLHCFYERTPRANSR